jgi:hypothetical protein
MSKKPKSRKNSEKNEESPFSKYFDGPPGHFVKTNQGSATIERVTLVNLCCNFIRAPEAVLAVLLRNQSLH